MSASFDDQQTDVFKVSPIMQLSNDLVLGDDKTLYMTEAFAYVRNMKTFDKMYYDQFNVTMFWIIYQNEVYQNE